MLKNKRVCDIDYQSYNFNWLLINFKLKEKQNG